MHDFAIERTVAQSQIKVANQSDTEKALAFKENHLLLDIRFSAARIDAVLHIEAA